MFQVLIPDLVMKESLSKIEEGKRDLETTLKRLEFKAQQHKSIYPFADICKIKIDTIRSCNEYEKEIEIILQKFDLINTTSENLLPIILDAYFNCEPPFCEKKKEEFPDVIMLFSIQTQYLKEELILLSSDSDWKKFALEKGWEHFGNIEDFLDSRHSLTQIEAEVIEENIQIIQDDLKEQITTDLFVVGDDCDDVCAHEELLDISNIECVTYEYLIIDRKVERGISNIQLYFILDLMFDADFSVFDINSPFLLGTRIH